MWRSYLKSKGLDTKHQDWMRPWDHEHQKVIRVAASGDDQLVGVDPEHAESFAAYYKLHSARKPMDDVEIGLG